MTYKTIYFIPILSVRLRKSLQYRCYISRENRGKSFVKMYVCFNSDKDFFTGNNIGCSHINLYPSPNPNPNPNQRFICHVLTTGGPIQCVVSYRDQRAHEHAS